MAIKRFIKVDNLCTFIITYEKCKQWKENALAKKCPNKRVKAAEKKVNAS